MKIIGKVTEVRILDVNDVIVFVKAGSPEDIRGKIVRFHITICNDVSGLEEHTDWTELAVGDLVQITKIYTPGEDYDKEYSLHVMQSEVLDANDLQNTKGL